VPGTIASMKKHVTCSFNVDIQEARNIQEKLQSQLLFRCPLRKESVERIAGVDVSYDAEGFARAGVVILSYPALQVIEVVTGRVRPVFPYVPGFLTFREGPAIEEAFSRIRVSPHIIFFDGQGYAHPRFFGIASHLGVLYGVPTVGVAKKKLVGEGCFPRDERGAYSWLIYRGKRVGAVLRTRTGVKPVFVSPGHCMGVLQAVHWTMRVTGKYRVPEPTRLAHIYSRNTVSEL